MMSKLFNTQNDGHQDLSLGGLYLYGTPRKIRITDLLIHKNNPRACFFNNDPTYAVR